MSAGWTHLKASERHCQLFPPLPAHGPRCWLVLRSPVRSSLLLASSHSRTLSRLWLTSHTCQETEFCSSCQLGKMTLCGFPHLLVGVAMACRHRRALHSCLILNSKHEFTCGLSLKGNSNIMSSRLLFQKMQTCTQPPFCVRGELVPEFQIYRGFFI